jgi:hypothetical protein
MYAKPAVVRAFLHLPKRLLLASRLTIDEGIAMNNSQLLTTIAANVGSFRGVTLSLLLVARPLYAQ